jgi:hypothetical protein
MGLGWLRVDSGLWIRAPCRSTLPATDDQQRRDRGGAQPDSVRTDPAQLSKWTGSKGRISEDSKQICSDCCAYG